LPEPLAESSICRDERDSIFSEASVVRPKAIDHLLSIMDDQKAPIDVRIEAAKKILEHCDATLEKLQKEPPK
jgi:hypothetical protein